MSSQLPLLPLALVDDPKPTQQPPAKEAPRELAPMLKQYLDVKRQYPEHLVLFQVGDFFEVFFDDARTVSDCLGIRLTSRDKNHPEPIPMCGVPIHAIENYLPRLLKKGHSCILIEQVEDTPKKGPVKRDIFRVITPGVRFDGDGLEERQSNYLATLLFKRETGTLVYGDVSTGSLQVVVTESLDELLDSLERIRPVELLLPSVLFAHPVDRNEDWLKQVKQRARGFNAQIRYRPFPEVSREILKCRLGELFSGSFGYDEQYGSLSRESLSTLESFVEFVHEVSFQRLPRFARFSVTERGTGVFLDSSTCRNLELFETRMDGERKFSLLAQIDYTKTPMGARLFQERLLQPSSKIAEIEARLDAVQELLEKTEVREEIRAALAAVRDLQRILSRILSARVSPRDLGALLDSIRTLPAIQAALSACSAPLLLEIQALFDPLPDLFQTLEGALNEELPAKLQEGGIFRAGYNKELDELRVLQTEATTLLAKLEAEERERSGISGLKIRYNNIFGYFIEITKAHLAKVPDRYERRQTLVNAERFVTKELKEFEQKILSARDKQLHLEKELFGALKDWVAAQASRIQQTATALSLIDVFTALSELAARHNYTRPEFKDSPCLVIREGRHPVIERVLGQENFVPNDTLLDTEARRFAVLTGPNMGGKSTYLRQVALIQLLAQMGSYVPARRAELGVVDRIFTRIGSADDLARGDSTFMVEMREAATIVRRATKASLVLIDEIGRGTATTDGLAIATAIAQWLLDRTRCKTIFATHFHELTQFGSEAPGAFCLAVGVHEGESEISFTHRIEERVGDRSYGLEVARLAGLPEELLARAEQVFQEIDGARGDAPNLLLELPSPATTVLPHDQRFTDLAHRIESLNPDRLTPVAALLELVELRSYVAELHLKR